MKVINIQSLVRSNILRVKPYTSARDEYTGSANVFIDANENPFPVRYNRYPDPHQRSLKQKISELKRTSPESIFVGNGSDEAIDLIYRAFCEPGRDNVIIPGPTYGMYAVSASVNDIHVKSVSLTPAFDLDTNAIVDAIDPNTKIIWLCSPNNPSGNLLTRDRIVRLLHDFSGLVVVDEAYVDFAGERSLIEELKNYQNLVVLQTLSKAWGMAALRVGIGIADPEIIDVLNRIKPPYNINQFSQELALEQLDQGEQQQAWVDTLLKERKMLTEQLNNLPHVKKVFPSHANFLLVRFDEAKKVYEYLVRKGIIVRDRSQIRGCEGCLRITVGTPEENNLLINSLRNL